MTDAWGARRPALGEVGTGGAVPDRIVGATAPPVNRSGPIAKVWSGPARTGSEALAEAEPACPRRESGRHVSARPGRARRSPADQGRTGSPAGAGLLRRMAGAHDGRMTADEDLLWDASDKSTRTVPRLRRLAVSAGCLGLIGLALRGEPPTVRWVGCAAAACLLVEITYWVWDRRRVVEARIVPRGAGGRASLRLRHAGGRITEHDPDRVARVLFIYDNVDSSARLRLRRRGKRLFFGRPGRPPVLAAWRHACPRAGVDDRNARWGMPGIPD